MIQNRNSHRATHISRAGILAILAVVAWFTAAFIFGALGKMNEPGRPPLVLGSFILLPILGFVAAYLISPSLRTFTYEYV